MIKGCDDVGCVTNDLLTSFFEQEMTESATAVVEEELSMMVQYSLKIDMSVKSPKGKMKLPFLEYKALLRTHGLKLVTEKTPKVAVRHVLSVIKLPFLRLRLEQNIFFSHIYLKYDFGGFMQHSIALSDAFERID